MITDSSAAKAAFRRILVRSVVVPIAVMAILGVAMFAQVTQLRQAAHAVEHTDDVIAKLYRAETKVVEGQSAVRGYMLIGEESYLDMYNDAAQSLPGYMAELRRLTIDRPQATAWCDSIEANRLIWFNYVNGRIEERRKAGQPLPIITKSIGSVAMSAMRDDFRLWLEQEATLRAERNQATQRWAIITMFGALFVPVVVGGFLAMLIRGQLRWLSQTYEGALARSRELSDSLERRVVERTLQLEASNGKLNDANRELEAFAYSVSHDLRAPMRHISGFANLLLGSPSVNLQPDDKENLNTIQQTAVTAGRMVDDLLAFSRIGRSQLKSDNINADAMVESTLRDLAPEIAKRKIEWNIGKLPPLRGDTGLMRLVFQNLLGNAVKYTGPRDVAHIAVGAKPDEGGTTYWIKDDGVGFDMEYAHKLFGVFQRLHRAEEFEGTGIGLANVRRIVTRHGGRVWAEGKPGEGATFYFFIPDSAPREAVPAGESEAL